jgi:DNA primase
MLEDLWQMRCTIHLAETNWAWRIVYPVKDREGNVITWQGRTIRKDVKPKYLLSGECACDPKSILYGIDAVPSTRVVVVEGAADVWKLGPGAVALLGMKWHVEQANILRQYAHRCIMLDEEEKAQKQAEKLATWLSFFPGTTEILEGIEKNPGDFSRDYACEVMQSLGF